MQPDKVSGSLYPALQIPQLLSDASVLSTAGWTRCSAELIRFSRVPDRRMRAGRGVFEGFQPPGAAGS